MAATSDGARIFAGDWSGELTAFATADGAKAGGLDTNPPRLEQRIAAAEKALAEVAAAEQARQAEAGKGVERWKDELEFSRQSPPVPVKE